MKIVGVVGEEFDFGDIVGDGFEPHRAASIYTQNPYLIIPINSVKKSFTKSPT